MSNVPESIETMIEGVRREAAALGDYDLDVRIAETQARRNVAAGHEYAESAEQYNRLLIALADVREEREAVRREIEDLTGPPSPIVRALTAEELAEIEFDDDTPEEPSC